MSGKKEKKERPANYEDKLKIKGTLDDILKASIKKKEMSDKKVKWQAFSLNSNGGLVEGSILKSVSGSFNSKTEVLEYLERNKDSRETSGRKNIHGDIVILEVYSFH